MYENQPAPKSVIRTFDYERDGQILVTAHTTTSRAISLVFKSGGRVIITHEWSVSDDGKTLTAKRTATNPQGQRAYSVQVYDKQ